MLSKLAVSNGKICKITQNLVPFLGLLFLVSLLFSTVAIASKSSVGESSHGLVWG